MRIVDKDAATGDARICLDRGEIIPAQCSNPKCRNVYQPEPGTASSVCPACGTLVDHEAGAWTTLI